MWIHKWGRLRYFHSRKNFSLMKMRGTSENIISLKAGFIVICRHNFWDIISIKIIVIILLFSTIILHYSSLRLRGLNSPMKKSIICFLLFLIWRPQHLIIFLLLLLRSNFIIPEIILSLRGLRWRWNAIFIHKRVFIVVVICRCLWILETVWVYWKLSLFIDITCLICTLKGMSCC